MRILVIPDTQIRPGVPIDQMRWAAKAVRDYKPSHVCHMGDHWDFPSLSSYSPRREIEGKRVQEDIDAGNLAMDLFWRQLKGLRNKPEFHFFFGNHCQRLIRYIDDNPVLEGVIGLDSLNLDGWTTHQFKEVYEIGDVWFSHYFYQPFTGRAYGGTAHNILKNVGLSFVQGHRQGKDLASRSLPNGRVQRALIAGSCYLHSEKYLGPQAKESWQGVIMLNDVVNGDYDMMELSLKYLCRRYEKKELAAFLEKREKL